MTTRHHETSLAHYTRLLPEFAVGLCPGQDLFLHADLELHDLAFLVGEAGYALGAGSIHYWLADSAESEQLVRCGTREHIERYFAAYRAYFDTIVERRGALILLLGDQVPADWHEGAARRHPEGYRTFVSRRGEAETAVFRELCRLEIPFTIAPVATPRWAGRVFPGLEPDEALRRLWEQIFHFTHADRDDAVDLLTAEERERQALVRRLDALAVEEVRILGGPTDLRMGLSPKARWHSTAMRTRDEQVFHMNFPSWEIFTTPDRRRTEGRLAASRPLRVRAGGRLVEDLVMDFAAGRVTAFEASAGREDFARCLETDDGARYLGELALVGEDSPVGRSGLDFGQVYLDENAASHVALGLGLTMGLEDGAELSDAELEMVGCNRSRIHSDILFGSPEISVVASRSRRGEVALMERGRWVEGF